MNQSTRLEDYRVWVALADGERLPVADYRLETDHRGRHLASGLRYHGSWLNRPDSFPLNPVHAPLSPDPVEWSTHETPAILDEVLPGRWERAVQQRVWGKRGDVDDLHAVLAAPRQHWRIGAIEILPADRDPPPLESSLRFADLPLLAEEAERTWQYLPPDLETLARMQAGSSVGGARPKVLVEDGGSWLVKFTRSDDAFDHARLECACLTLAERAGASVAQSRLVEAGRDMAVALRRFDVTPGGGRIALISANALLKDPHSQADPIHADYQDLADLIRRHSIRPEADLAQLYRQMLINEAIGNRDDHLKNFSFLLDSEGLRLSPAYDLVPSEAVGAWSQLGFGDRPTLPRPGTKEALQAAKRFQLTPKEAREMNQTLTDAILEIETIADKRGLSDTDRRALYRHLPAGP